MSQSRRRRARAHGLRALLVASLLCLVACGAEKKAVSDSPNPTLASASIEVGPARILAEVARTETERERGLMHRSSLAEGKGMLFIFDRDERLAFWMKNTTIPLSIAFISSDGTIRQLADLEPLSLATLQSERSVRYALEVPRGWFERAKVRVGDKVGLGGVD
jgi:uncharacterized protein